MQREERVLSIQSHVVHGYVGNKSAVFPLQLLGFDVDFINSVQFSNHTGYKGGFTGTTLNGDALNDLIHGLEKNDLLYYSHMLTGYIGSLSFLDAVANIHGLILSRCPEIIYLCDPVMGDISPKFPEGKLYVPEALIEAYKNKILPIATIITPNQFECELLTSIKIKSLPDAYRVIDALHKKGPKVVVITSLDLTSSSSTLEDVEKQMSKEKKSERRKMMKILGSYINGDGKQTLHSITFPMLDKSYTGTGDLISALILAWLHRTEWNLPIALGKALASVQAVLQKTKECSSDELKLIQSQKEILNPDTSQLSGETYIKS